MLYFVSGCVLRRASLFIVGQPIIMSPNRVVTPQHYLHLRIHAPVNVAPLIGIRQKSSNGSSYNVSILTVNETRRKRSNAVSLFISFMENIYLLTKNGITPIAIG